jgi:hypothetical protein
MNKEISLAQLPTSVRTTYTRGTLIAPLGIRLNPAHLGEYPWINGLPPSDRYVHRYPEMFEPPTRSAILRMGLNLSNPEEILSFQVGWLRGIMSTQRARDKVMEELLQKTIDIQIRTDMLRWDGPHREHKTAGCPCCYRVYRARIGFWFIDKKEDPLPRLLHNETLSLLQKFKDGYSVYCLLSILRRHSASLRFRLFSPTTTPKLIAAIHHHIFRVLIRKTGFQSKPRQRKRPNKTREMNEWIADQLYCLLNTH